MNKRSIIELTALLDIILILLFAFMMQVNANEQNIQSEQQVLQQKNVQLVNAQKAFELENELLRHEIEQMRFLHDKEKQTLDTLTRGIARFLQVDEAELLAIIEQSENQTDQQVAWVLQQFTDDTQVMQELWKHEVLAKRFYFIEVGLKYSYNQIYINGNPTKVTINHQELTTTQQRKMKKEEIKEAIEKVINAREGGVGMVFLSLTLLDEHVYQYAYELAWEAIKEEQEKYGTEKMFVSEYTLLQ